MIREINDDTTFMAACNAVCRDLPDCWSIEVNLERNSGWVSLVNPDGEEIEYPCNYEDISQQLADALEHAIEIAKEPTP